MSTTLVTILVDLAAIVILILSAIIGKKRGFIKTISSLLALVLSFSISGYLANVTTPIISEKYVTPYIEETISTKIFENVPDNTSVDSAMEQIGIPKDIIKDAVTDTFVDPITAVATAVAEKITNAVLFLVYFLVLLIVITLLLKLINLATKFPGLNFANKLAGLIVGLIWGYFLVVSASYLLSQFRIILTPDLIEKTTILKQIINFSLISLF